MIEDDNVDYDLRHAIRDDRSFMQTLRDDMQYDSADNLLYNCTLDEYKFH